MKQRTLVAGFMTPCLPTKIDKLPLVFEWGDGGPNMTMPLIPDMAVFQRRLATLPLVTYQAAETVLSAASTTGQLLILKEGAVAVVKEGVEIARVMEPGAVFGELSVLLDQPHTADVRALETSQFHVADAATILRVDPIALLYVATVLAQRLDSANRGLLELKRQVEAGEPRSVIGKTVEKIEELLGATGANLMYAGYPYDPFAPDAPRS
jgi:CRP-like cAMP-binding protein